MVYTRQRSANSSHTSIIFFPLEKGALSPTAGCPSDLTQRRRRDLQDGLRRAAGRSPHATGRRQRRRETPVTRVPDRGGGRCRRRAWLCLRLPLPRRHLPPFCLCPPLVQPRTALSFFFLVSYLPCILVRKNGDLGGYCARRDA